MIHDILNVNKKHTATWRFGAAILASVLAFKNQCKMRDRGLSAWKARCKGGHGHRRSGGKDEDRGKRWMRPRDQDGEKAGKTERKMLRDVGALPQFSEYWSGVQVLEDGSWTPLLSSPRSPPPPLHASPSSLLRHSPIDFSVLYSTLAVSRVWGGKDFHSLPPLSNPRLSPSP